MPLIGFTVFKEKILDETKHQTIRKLRKRPIQEGDILHLYWKLRTKQCERLGIATCNQHFLVNISSEYWVGRQRIRITKFENGEWCPMSYKETLDLAVRDGFKDDVEMLLWFTARHPLSQIFEVIRWGHLMRCNDSS